MADAGNATMRKFGFPRTLIAETPEWVVLLRPQQVTLGSLVLVSREPVTAFAEVSERGFVAMKPLIGRIEAVLGDFVRYDRINYLMLMMVDPDVHFHVLPRYEGERSFDGLAIADAGWPGPPALQGATPPDEETLGRLVAELARRWSAA